MPAGSEKLQPYQPTGHPSIEQLMAEQGTGPIHDPKELLGPPWPDEESPEQFAATLRAWRRNLPESDASVE